MLALEVVRTGIPQALMPTSLALTGRQHRLPQAHLFPGDRLEAVAFLQLRSATRPRRDCTARAVRQGHSLHGMQGARARPRHVVYGPASQHPRRGTDVRLRGCRDVTATRRTTGAFRPSTDASDRDLFPGIHAWMDSPAPHSSAVMLPDGQIFGRVVHRWALRAASEDSPCGRRHRHLARNDRYCPAERDHRGQDHGSLNLRRRDIRSSRRSSNCGYLAPAPLQPSRRPARA